MLIVQRHAGQIVIVDEDIEVMPMRYDPYSRQFHIGIRAPKEKVILREELWLRQKQKTLTKEEYSKLLDERCLIRGASVYNKIT